MYSSSAVCISSWRVMENPKLASEGRMKSSAQPAVISKHVVHTPHEFAGSLAACEAMVGREAGNLADLYCCAAYSSGGLPRDRVGRLQAGADLLNDLRARGAILGTLA
mgnify:CR=1 FL=1